MNEQELIDGLIIQTKDAIQYLVTTYQKNVIKTAYYFVENMEDAEDISQEVFLEIIHSIKHYSKKSSLYTWIYRITVNRSLDHLRRQKRRKLLHQVGTFMQISNGDMNRHIPEPSITDTGNEDNEKKKVIEDAIGHLPENQRIAFVLSKYDDLAYKEIADIMNLSLSSVESLLYRAKMNLQHKLVNYFSEYAKVNR
jgi:RNA polymerase sigma factor (sigma-70 family)